MTHTEPTEQSRPEHDLPTPFGAFVFASVLAFAAAVALRVADSMTAPYAGLVDAGAYGALLLAGMTLVAGGAAFIIEHADD